ncbi:MAG TPA: GtrA family protein [Candidatus Dormibacteraeota bacterium]|nr:GtrA family protein [Candidatus Dormibacteraeota bacterium]
MGKLYDLADIGFGPADELVREHGQRVALFCFVGVVGAATTIGGTAVLYHHLFFLPLWLASGVSIQTAILVTFTLNSLLTWRDRDTDSFRRRALTFEAVSLGGLAIQEGALLVGVAGLHLFYLLALVIGIGLAAMWNYLVNNRVTFA